MTVHRIVKNNIRVARLISFSIHLEDTSLIVERLLLQLGSKKAFGNYNGER